MESLCFLGTGSALVTRCYNTCFVIETDRGRFLTDAGGGNGILAQCERAGIEIEHLSGMFVTHAHTDHILGTIWVIRCVAVAFIAGSRTDVFTIYCHGEVADDIFQFCRMTLSERIVGQIGRNIQIHKVDDGDFAVCRDLQFTFFDLRSVKKRQFGYRVVLPDGQTLVCQGDEPYNPNRRAYVADCDWLLSEAFCLYAERDRFKPYEKGHSTALEAAKAASELGVRNLVLFHTEDRTLQTRKVTYGEEAAAAFSGKIFVPNDLERIDLI